MHVEGNEIRCLCLTPLTKINSKWIKDIHIRPEATKLEGKIDKKLLDIGLGNNFFNMTHTKYPRNKVKEQEVELH